MTQNSTPTTTGKYLVLLQEESISDGVQLLSQAVGVRATDTLVFGDLGVAVVDAEPTQFNVLNIGSQGSPILAVEPEQVVYALQDVTRMPSLTSDTVRVSLDYLRGYRDAVTTLTDHVTYSRRSC
jgi:hypothetical protein